MVYHARELPSVSSGQEPSTYVKVYLTPDPQKLTKRKTKVVRRSCHPSFMEMVPLFCYFYSCFNFCQMFATSQVWRWSSLMRLKHRHQVLFLYIPRHCLSLKTTIVILTKMTVEISPRKSQVYCGRLQDSNIYLFCSLRLRTGWHWFLVKKIHSDCLGHVPNEKIFHL